MTRCHGRAAGLSRGDSRTMDLGDEREESNIVTKPHLLPSTLISSVQPSTRRRPRSCSSSNNLANPTSPHHMHIMHLWFLYRNSSSGERTRCFLFFLFFYFVFVGLMFIYLFFFLIVLQAALGFIYLVIKNKRCRFASKRSGVLHCIECFVHFLLKGRSGLTSRSRRPSGQVRAQTSFHAESSIYEANFNIGGFFFLGGFFFPRRYMRREAVTLR